MKFFGAASLLCLSLAGTSSALDTSALRAGSGLSPVTRVVELLKGLSAEVEKDAKAEEDLYETFVCWAKSMLSQKDKSNAAAEARSDELSTYIADLDNGRVELTSERSDITKEIEELSSDIEVATQMREKEKKDYEDAKDEMEKAIDALTQAVEVLRTATEGHAEGVLLATHSGLHTGFEARASQAAALARAVGLGEKVLTKGDASFLRRLLTGEVPVVDWKKMNRKATFKMDYKVRSFKIQDVLAKLLENFASDLKEANEKEAKAVALYDTLMESKNAEKSSAQDALAKMEKETSARGMSREESASELDALTTQIKNDETYIEQVQKALAEKKQEWKDRTVLRTGELAAISKAVEIMHNDDARDLFKKSFASQDKSAASFVQVASSSRSSSAIKVLKAAARQSRDARLSAIAEAATVGHFDEVIAAVDKMLDMLQKEEDEDLAKKEQCEADRAADTREAIATSRAMDELSDQITADRSKIAELTAEIEAKTQQVAETMQELKEATEMREKEHAEWMATDKDDKDAKTIVGNAKEVLAKFYSENGLMLVQKSKQQPFVSASGEAPPPPPPTWEAPYGGKTDEQQGIVAVLEMIMEDIQKDITKSKEEDEASEALFQTSKAAMETEIQDLETSISELEGDKSEKESAVTENTADRLGKKGELGVVMQRISDSEPGCDYYSINYPLRVKNRQIEVDGLNKAKVILSGGAFTAPLDPNREMKVGDAFLQRRTKFLGRAAVL